MDTSLLTIESIFADSNSAQLVTTDNLLESSKNPEQTSQATFRSIYGTNIHEDTSYNTIIQAQNNATNKLFPELDSTIALKTDSEQPQNLGISNKPEKQNPSPNMALQPNIVQLYLSQQAQNIEQDKIGTDKLVNPEPVPLQTRLKADQLAPTTEQALKSAENETPPFISPGVIDLKTIPLNISEQSLTPDIQLNKVENVAEIEVSNKTLLVIEDNSSELLNQKAVINADGKITVPDEKTTIVFPEGASDGQKITTLSIDSLPVQNNLPQTQEKAEPGQETSPYVTEKPTANETTFPQQSHPDVHKLSDFGEQFGPELTAEELIRTESLDGDNKEQNLLNDSSTQELITTELSDGQRKHNSNPTSDSVSKPIFERLFSSNNTQTNLASESLNFTEAANTSNSMPPRNTSVDEISQQISESIQNSLHQQTGRQQITVRLNPPELGRVCIKFHQQQDQLTGILEVDRTQTKREIEQALPQIFRNLGDAGIQLKRLEVNLTNQTDQQLTRDQSPQYESFQQHHFEWNDNQYNQGATGANEWFVNDNSYENNPETQLQLTDSSINMLV